jgi:prepilin-type N-terminal cleavage/methylation domain-containing protein
MRINQKGFSLVESLAALALFSSALMAISAGNRFVSGTSASLSQKATTWASAGLLIQQVKSYGRMAQKCEKETTTLAYPLSAQSSSLQCIGKFFGEGAVSVIRFTNSVVDGVLELQKNTNNTGWTTLLRFPGVDFLYVCDDNGDSNGNPCGIGSSALDIQTALHSSPLDIRVGRFFRFSISAGATSYQSAFYVRNPSEAGLNVAYGTGG